MRRGRTVHEDIDLEINEVILPGGLSKLIYYSTDGNQVKETCPDARKRIDEIKKEREKFKLLVDGKIVYPFRGRR